MKDRGLIEIVMNRKRYEIDIMRRYHQHPLSYGGYENEIVEAKWLDNYWTQDEVIRKIADFNG